MKTKKSILSLFMALTFVLSSLFVKAQLPIDKETGKVQFTGVVDLPNQTKEIIHKKAKMWITSTLKSGDNMVELNDANLNQLTGTGNLLLDSLVTECKKCFAKNAILNFKFIVSCKDNKYKYSVENFILAYEIGISPRTEYIETGLEKIKTYSWFSDKKAENFQITTKIYLKRKIDELIANFISYMKKEDKTDW